MLRNILIGAALCLMVTAQDARAQVLTPEEERKARNQGYLYGLAAGAVIIAVMAMTSGDGDENTASLIDAKDEDAASLSFRPVVFDRTFGFDVSFRPNVGPGYIGFRMIRPEGAEPHMSLRYAIGF